MSRGLFQENKRSRFEIVLCVIVQRMLFHVTVKLVFAGVMAAYAQVYGDNKVRYYQVIN